MDEQNTSVEKLNHALTLTLGYEIVIEDLSDLEVGLEKAGFTPDLSEYGVDKLVVELMRLVATQIDEEEMPLPGNEECDWMSFWLLKDYAGTPFWSAHQSDLSGLSDNLKVLVGPIRFQGTFKSIELR